MSGIFRKVMCSDKLPETPMKNYYTNLGSVFYFGVDTWSGLPTEVVEWWLEEIELPSEEDIVKIAKEFEIYGTECSWWMFGFRKAIELIKGGTK